MSEERKHPDIFTPEEAAAYLHQPGDESGTQTLKGLRDKGLLRGFWLGPTLLYHRRDLDLAVEQIFNIISPIKTRQSKSRGVPELRINGG